MPAESPLVRYAARTLAVACAVLLLSPATGALAQPRQPVERGNRTQEIADALTESRVHVNSAYESAFPPADQERLDGAIDASGLDLYVVAVPLTAGGTWNGDPATLATVLHDRMGGGEGHYLVYDGSTGFRGADFGPGAEEAAPAHYGALAASYQTGFDSSVLEQAEAAVEAALSDDPEGAYDAALRAYEEANPDITGSGETTTAQGTGDAAAPEDEAGSGPLLAVGAVVAVLLALVLALLVRNRLTARRGRRKASSITQHAAFDNADRAQLDSLMEQAEHDLIEVGERLSRLDTGTDLGSRAQQSLRVALDARSAAASVHDRMVAEGPTLPDAVGVLVLLDMAEDAMENVSGGTRSAVRRRHCYANPLHGTETKVTPWREFGGTRTVRVPLCAECARAVRVRTRPVVLPAEHGGRTVPYYEVPSEDSVWAATGYGTLTDDLVQRVQRGDHRASGRAR